MYHLPVDIERDRIDVPPLGKWRVIDRISDSMRGARRVGDYDTLSVAMDQLHAARPPYIRSVINDMGVEVASVTPATWNLPESGPES